MSYPSQPQFTPPYGQPQAPRQSNNLWLVGGSVVIVLAVIMTVTLVILQRANDGETTPTAADGTGDATTEDAPTSTEETTPGEAEPTDDGGGGGFTEATCGALDMSKYELVFGEGPDPDETATSASSSGDTGSLSCTFYNSNADSSTLYVTSSSDASSTMDWYEDDKEYWEDNDDYTITDRDGFGDAAYHLVYGDTYQKRQIHAVYGTLDIEIDLWLYPDEQDTDVADIYLEDMTEQIAELFKDYR